MAELNNDESPGAVHHSIDEDGTLILALTGEIDMANVPALHAEIDQILARKTPRRIAFELSGLRFMDSSGIALLLTIAAQDATIELRRPSPAVRRVIELSGLESTLPMVT